MKRFIPVIIISILLPVSNACFSQVKLPRIISDGMVIQRGEESKIWGWASPGEEITLEFLGKSYNTITLSSGRWQIGLMPSGPGGPYTMKVMGSDTVTVNDILVGDVWLCSGQSNMELPVRRVLPIYREEVYTSDNSFIRSFTVPKDYYFKSPKEDLASGRWVSAEGENILGFSATAWFFAREIYSFTGVPVGLLTSAYGGSPAEAWIGEEDLGEFPVHLRELEMCKSDSLVRAIMLSDRIRSDEWYRVMQMAGGVEVQGTETTGWSKIAVPGYWDKTELQGFNGSVWFRKEIVLPAEASGEATELNLGRIVDADSAFVNGKYVGNTTYQYPPRWYNVPEGILKEGKNVILLKVISVAGTGGFVPGKPYLLTLPDTTIDLTGEWSFRRDAAMPALQPQTFFGYKPAGLFNAMLSPLLNYTIKGILWYQGESNVTRAEEYRSLFPAMIRDWRKSFGQGDIPFLFVQLPNYGEPALTPEPSSWAMLREAQAEALSLPETGMAVTLDIGEWNDIHPLDKKDVGYRLALLARNLAYGQKELISSGPVFKSMKISGNKIIIGFSNTGTGLCTSDGKAPTNFLIAGPDMRFIEAEAVISGNNIILSNRKVRKPEAVRYAWADNPVGVNLCNKEGLPAAPFRTDHLER